MTLKVELDLMARDLVEILDEEIDEAGSKLFQYPAVSISAPPLKFSLLRNYNVIGRKGDCATSATRRDTLSSNPRS
jgi:hypothetical protein